MKKRAQTAIVTGAGTGIGREIARRLLAMNHGVALVGRTESTLRETAEADEEGSLIIPGDIGSAETCARIVERTLEHFGGVDVLVNNAGVAPLEKIGETSQDTIRSCLAINLEGPMNLVISCWPHFTSQRRGCIVNISSVASIDPFPGFLAYAASKSGLDSVTRSIVAEGAISGIRGFTINPGAVETAMLRANFDTTLLPEENTLRPADIADFAIGCIRGDHDDLQGRQNPISRT